MGRELKRKIIYLMIGAFLSGIFVNEIINSIQDLSFIFSTYIKLIIFLLFITDVIVYAKTGEEIINYMLNKLRRT